MNKKELKRRVAKAQKRQAREEKKNKQWRKRHPILAFFARFGHAEMPNGFYD